MKEEIIYSQNSTYHVYVKYSLKENTDGVIDQKGLYVKKTIPKISFDKNTEMRISLKWFLYFNIFIYILHGCKGIFKEYQLYKDNRLVCKVVAMSYVPIYKFMPKDGIHVGFARTEVNYRGKGYYTILLKYVMKDLFCRNIYIFTEHDNIASQKGIEKAGFTYIKECKKCGRYFMEV